MSRQGSTKPCPGCGEVKEWRKADEVCRDCKTNLDLVRDLQAAAEPKSGQIIIAFAEQPHWNQYIHDHSGNHSGIGPGRKLQSILFRLCKSVSTLYYGDYTNQAQFNLLGKMDGLGNRYTCSRETAEAIRDLRQIIQEALDLAYDTGKRDGRNLLMGLANGDLSPNDFLKEEQK